MKETLLVALLVVAALVAFLLLRRSKPLRYRKQSLTQLPRFLEALFAQSGDGSLLFAENERAEGFLQFKLIRTSPRSGSIRMSVPDAPWSREAFASTVMGLREAGMVPAIEQTGSGPTRRFLHLSFPGTAAEQVDKLTLAARVAGESLGFREEDTYSVWVEGSLDGAVVREWIQRQQK